MAKQFDISLKGNALIVVENTTKLRLFIRQNICASEENLQGALGLHGAQF
jgi:hypothetical protein